MFKKILLAGVIVLPLIGDVANADSVSEQEPSPSDVEVQTPSKKEIDKVNAESALENFVSTLPIGCLAYILQSDNDDKCEDKKEEMNKNSFEVR